VLLVCPPGTGKTLIARAVAGEANVPFFTISGSDFVDEFVAVGPSRGAGLFGGNDEREQTLNQLLVEMDGLEGSEGVIVIAARNRPDVLDPALLRPGRFDRQVVVPLPDVKGREQILKVHMRKVPMANDVEPLTIARGTPGFSGADLANLVNEAALFAARENSRDVRMDHFERAKDKIMMGAERRTMIMSEADRYSHSKTSLESRLASLYGGRVAEELIFGDDKVTTGASNDIQRATQLARDMVTKYGLSEELGPMTYTDEEDEVFLGRSVTQHKHVSEETARKIDEVVRGVIDRAYNRARDILQTHADKLENMAQALLQYETIDRDQIASIMAGREPGPPKDWRDPKPRSGGTGGSRGESPIGGPATQPRVQLDDSDRQG